MHGLLRIAKKSNMENVLFLIVASNQQALKVYYTVERGSSENSYFAKWQLNTEYDESKGERLIALADRNFYFYTNVYMNGYVMRYHGVDGNCPANKIEESKKGSIESMDYYRKCSDELRKKYRDIMEEIVNKWTALGGNPVDLIKNDKLHRF
jgi:hypothetical protein